MNRVLLKLLNWPENKFALPTLLFFSSVLLGTLYLFRLESDLNFDGEIYIAAARKFSLGMYIEAINIYDRPLYPYLLSLINRIFPDWILSAKLFSLFSILLSIIPLYFLSIELLGRYAAFWACLTYTLLPEVLLQSNSVMREPHFILFSLWSVYFVQKTFQSNKITHLLCAFLFAFIANLFRVEALVYFPIFLIFFCIAAIFRETRRKELIRLALTWIALIACFFSPAIIFYESRQIILNSYNEWVISIIRLRDPIGNYAQVAAQLMEMQSAASNSDVGMHFAEVAKDFMPLIYFLGMFHMFSVVILKVNIISLIWGLVKCDFSEKHLIVLMSSIFLFASAYGFFIRQDQLLKRYLLLPSILLLPWIGYGVNSIFKFVQKRLPKYALLCIMLTYFILPIAEFDKYFSKPDDLKMKVAMWIANHNDFKNVKIIFSDPVIKIQYEIKMNFCCDEKLFLSNVADDKYFSKLAQYAIDYQADVIVVFTRTERKDLITKFNGYGLIKEFSDNNKTVKILGSLERFTI